MSNKPTFLSTLHAMNQNRKNRGALQAKTPKTSSGKMTANGFKADQTKAQPINGIKPYPSVDPKSPLS